MSGEPELAVEYTFGQFRSWIEERVRAHDGQVLSVAGSELMCVFTDDAAAVRTARELQAGLAEFNRSRNRLSNPFEIRCGLSAGEVALDPAMPPGRLPSPVTDRAAKLQKSAAPGDIVVGRELAAAALEELGALAPLNAGTGEPGFSWRAGKKQLD